MAFNIQAAKQAGYSDQEIQQYLTSKQGATTPTPQPETNNGGFSNYLPLLGAIGGSFIGSPILGGVLGAGAGTLAKQAIQGKADPGEVIKESAFAGLGGLAGKGLGALVGKVLPSALTKTGESAIASQYNVPRNVARGINFPQSIKDLTKYGITDMTKIGPAAETVTGANGIVSKLTRAAVAKANPVNLGEDQTALGATSSVLQMAQDLVANPSITPATETKFMNFVNKGVSKAMGGEAGNITGSANPSEVFGFIQQLEKQAAGITRGRAPTAITAEDKALANSYTSLADELKHRLFNLSGGNDAVAEGLLTPEQFQQLHAIHPQLATDISSAKSVRELRGIAAPFVQGNQAAAETAAGSQFGFQNLAGSAKGIGKMVPTLANPLAPVTAALSAPGVNSAVGGAAIKGAEALKNLPLPATDTLQRIGVSSATGLGTTPDSAQAAELPTIQGEVLPSDSTGQQGDLLKAAFIQAMLQNPKQATTIKTIYDFINPKPPTGTADRAASLRVGEQVVDRAISSLKGYGPIQGRLFQFQLSAGGGAGVPPEVTKTNTSFNLLRQNVVRALQGARMSDKDIQIAEQYTPTITDTNETVQAKLQVLKQILQEARGYLQTTNQNYTSPQTGIPAPINSGL